MVEIIPAILEQDEEAIAEKFSAVELYAERVQLDVMDGVFVPNITFNTPERLGKIIGDVAIECHLMIEDPVEMAEAWAADPRVDRLIFHYESLTDVKKAITRARELNVEVAIAINPDTETALIQPYLDDVDMILVMGVKPGFSGQSLDSRTAQKVAEIRGYHSNIPIEVDGGVNEDTIKYLAEAGATRFVAASALFNKPNIENAINLLLKKAKV